MARSRFGPQRSRYADPQINPANSLRTLSVKDLRSLNLVAPDELLADGDSPFLKNARYYAENDQGSRVAISTRKGPAFYTTPVGETLDDKELSTTGAADQPITTTDWLAEKITAVATGRMTKVELNLKLDTGLGPIIVKLYSDDSGEPGTLLATSSVLSSSLTSSYGYATARFIRSPQVVASTVYWLVAHVQDNGSGNYDWSSTTTTTTGLTSDDSGATWSAASFSLNYNAYVSSDLEPIGYYREKTRAGTLRTLLAVDDSLYAVDDATGSTTSLESGNDTDSNYYSFARLQNRTYYVNGYDTSKYLVDTTITEIPDAPVGKLIIEHKNRIFIVRADDSTRVEFSDLNDGTAYASTSFFHVPSPETGDPITAAKVFQDNLVFFTRRNKYILYGTDSSTFSLRQATGTKGAVHARAVTQDENYIYFMSDDGVYRFDGSTDTRISDKVQPIVSQITNKERVGLVYHDRKLRVYYGALGSAQNNAMLLYDTVYGGNDFNGWFNDTNTYVKDGFVFDQEANQDLVEVSSVAPALYFGERQFSDLGSPIDFEYRTKYFDFQTEDREKLPRRFYPILRGQDESYDLIVELDKDFQNSPNAQTIAMQGTGDLWGGGDLWGSTFEYGSNNFLRKRLSGNGEASYIQARFRRLGVNNPVEIIGYRWYFKTKRVR